MKDIPLDAIDQSLINAGEFLGMVEEDRRRLDCLRTFADSLEVVEWIRHETKGTFILQSSIQKVKGSLSLSLSPFLSLSLSLSLCLRY